MFYTINRPENCVAQVVWASDCLRIIAHGGPSSCEGVATVRYEVELAGGEVLYSSESYFAVQHFLQMLTEPEYGRFVA